jgi:hypothetical protein
VDNNFLDLGMSKSGFIHTLPSGRLIANLGLGWEFHTRTTLVAYIDSMF